MYNEQSQETVKLVNVTQPARIHLKAIVPVDKFVHRISKIGD